MLIPRTKPCLILWVVVLFAAVALIVQAAPDRDWRILDDDDWCDDNRGKRVCEVREITLPADRDLIDLACTNGSVTVEGWDRDEIYIKAKIQVKAHSEWEARDILSEIEIKTGSRIRAKGPKGKWFGIGRRGGWSVSYRMKVPVKSNVKAHSTNGSVKVSDVDGEIGAGTTNGRVRLSHVSGYVYGTTVNGGVEVFLDGDSWQGEGLDLKTTNGSVLVEMPAGYSARLEASTINGGIRVDHPVKIHSKTRRRLKATIGDGGPTIKVRTVNGGVKIRESD